MSTITDLNTSTLTLKAYYQVMWSPVSLYLHSVFKQLKTFNAEKSDFFYYNSFGWRRLYLQNLQKKSEVKIHIVQDRRILCQKSVHVNPVDIGASVWFTLQTEARSFISQEPLSPNRLYSTKECWCWNNLWDLGKFLLSCFYASFWLKTMVWSMCLMPRFSRNH